MEKGINLFCYTGKDKIDASRQIELMAENGFGHTFVMADNPQLTDGLVDKVKRAGIVFDTLHMPFEGINNIWKDGIDTDATMKRLLAGIDACANYCIPIAVMHLSSGRPAPRISDAGHRNLDKLMEYARRKNVTIAYENQRFLANLASVMEDYPDAGFCWDIGHEGCFANGMKYMPLFGKRLSTVHIHDNHYMKDEDEHLVPFDGIINFEETARLLAKFGFLGTVMLEVFTSESRIYDDFSAEEYYRHAGQAAQKLADLIEKKRADI